MNRTFKLFLSFLIIVILGIGIYFVSYLCISNSVLKEDMQILEIIPGDQRDIIDVNTNEKFESGVLSSSEKYLIPGYVILIKLLVLVLCMDISYLIVSNFVKKTIKETFENRGIVWLYIILSLLCYILISSLIIILCSSLAQV